MFSRSVNCLKSTVEPFNGTPFQVQNLYSREKNCRVEGGDLK